MPSPFPGMNPYLEDPAQWRGFHGLMLGQMTFALTPAVGPKYYVEYEEALRIDDTSPDEGGRLFAVADVAVTDSEAEVEPDTGGVAVARGAKVKPLTRTVRLGLKKKHRWLTIRDSKSREVVTVIELLSPSNKGTGDDREAYLRKRLTALGSSSHFVEIDLLRGGGRMPFSDPPPCDYCVLVSRQPVRPKVHVWPIFLRDALPPVPIPLRTGEPEVALDVKAVLDAVYDGAGYARRAYDDPPVPPLSPRDAKWAAKFVPAPASH